MALHSPRLALPYGKWPGIDPFKLDPIAKAVFGVAKITFEVCGPYWRIRTRGNG